MWVVIVTSLSAGRRSFASRSTSGGVGLNGAPGNGPKPVTRMRRPLLIPNRVRLFFSLSPAGEGNPSPQQFRDLVRPQPRRDATFGDRGLGRLHFCADRR